MARKTTSAEIEAIHTQSFGYAIALLHKLFRERISEALAGTDLHLGQVLLLATLRAQRELHGDGTLTQTRLGQLTGIEKSSLVLMLDALEKQGWVERRRHPGDRRAHSIHLTDDGARRFEAIGVKLHAQQQKNLAPLSVAEREEMMAMMTRLISHLRAS